MILPLRVTPQPKPPIWEGGDCGACVLSGLLGIDVSAVYAKYRPEKQPFSWITMRQALWDAHSEGLIERFTDRVPFWPDVEAVRTFGDPGWMAGPYWFDWVSMGIDAGYYGLANVVMEGGGVNRLPDHWLMICGWREVDVPGRTPNAGTWVSRQLLLSCSSTRTPAEEWIDHSDFLRERGGYNLFLVRPGEH